MLAQFRSRLTYANVMATIAVFVALGGSSYAAVKVSGKNIVNSSVTGKDVKNNSLTGTDIKKLRTGDFARGQVPRGEKGEKGDKGDPGPATGAAGGDLTGNYPNPLVADNAITSAKVLDDTQPGGGLQDGDLATNSVGSSEIQTDAVGPTEIQNDSIDSGEIVDFGLSNQDVGVLFAELSSAGVLDNSSGGVTATKLAGTGVYEVDFGRTITSCTSVATIGPSGSGSATGEINVADRGGNAEAVFVDTNDSAGAAADKPFRLVVVC